jgi:adenosylcobinamide-GDP ribazoletransferase
MTEFLLALQFLSIIPVKVKYSAEKFAGAMIFFPVAGLLLGLLPAGVNMLMIKAGFDALLTSTITIILLIVLMGGLHLDGLSDTFDGLYGGKSIKDKLRIMRDPHIGSMGTLALICVIILKIAALNAVTAAARPAAIVLMCISGRWAMVFVMFLFPYARKDGKAKSFMENSNLTVFICSTTIALATAFMIWRVKGVISVAVVALVSYAVSLAVSKKINGITGDTIGTVNEFAEIAILLAVCLTERVDI